MDRKEFLKVSALAGAGLATLGASAGMTSAATRGKSVIAVLCDDLNKDGVLPEIAQLVGDQGATFEHTVGTCPVCCPARATLFRGQMGHNHRVRYNDGPDGGLHR